jgi:hypothetical protein
MNTKTKIYIGAFIVFYVFLSVRDAVIRSKFNTKMEQANIALIQAAGMKFDSLNNVVRVANEDVFKTILKENSTIKNDLKELGIKYKSLQRVEVINNTYVINKTFTITDTLKVGIKSLFADTTTCIKIYGSVLVDTANKLTVDIYRKEYNNNIRIYPYVEKINWWKFGQKRRNGLKTLSFRNNYIPRVQTKSDCGDIRIDVIENIEAIKESINDK